MQEYFSDALRIPTQKLPSAQGKPGPLSATEVLSVGAVMRTPLRHSLFIFNVNHNKEVFFCQADPDRL